MVPVTASTEASGRSEAVVAAAVKPEDIALALRGVPTKAEAQVQSGCGPELAERVRKIKSDTGPAGLSDVERAQ